MISSYNSISKLELFGPWIELERQGLYDYPKDQTYRKDHHIVEMVHFTIGLVFSILLNNRH